MLLSRSCSRSLGLLRSQTHTPFAIPRHSLAASKPFHTMMHPRGSTKVSSCNDIRQKTSAICAAYGGLGAPMQGRCYSTQSPATHPAFEIVQQSHVSEYAAAATIFKHRKTGAEILSIERDDDNKVFGITFRTPVDNSAGIPHILEHSVLCGSRKYPTKEPFVEMLRGSLKTFLNAFTYPDRTCYPVASQNTKDFYNLVNVYMDAVFHPRAITDPRVLAQEGWHYEMSDSGDAMAFKGVVFNEMKGVYSQPESLLSRHTYASLFPDSTYRHDYGGDPVHIPSLTFDQFREFHAKYYHPTNSRIFFYGNDNVQDRLELVDEYLREYNHFPVARDQSQVTWQKRSIAEPCHVSYPYPATSAEPKRYCNMAWLINDQPLTLQQDLELGILNHILMGSTASILRKALTDAGIGDKVIGGLESELLQKTFTVGMKGLSNDDATVQNLEQIVLETFEGLVKNGVPKDAIEASMNSVEFSLREFNVGSFPKGLAFMIEALKYWNYDMDPINALRFEEPLRQVKLALERGDHLFENLIQNYLLLNKHRVTLTLVPDTNLENTIKEAERQVLAEAKSKMSAEEIQQVIAETKALQLAQATQDPPEAKATIPRLTLADVDRAIKSIPIETQTIPEGITVVKHDLPTSGILYADVGFDISGLSLEELSLLGLYSRMMNESGTSKMDQVQLDRHVMAHTGGVHSHVMLSSKPKYSQTGELIVSSNPEVVAYLFIRGKATTDKLTKLFDIFHMIATDANLSNQQRFIEMVREKKASLEASVLQAGQRTASLSIMSRHSALSYVTAQASGVPAIAATRALLAKAETTEGWAEILKTLENIRAKMIQSRSGMIINLTGDKQLLEVGLEHSRAFASRFDQRTSVARRVSEWHAAWQSHVAANSQPLREAYVVPTMVNYVAKGIQVFEEGEKVAGHVSVAQRMLRTGHLWEKVRVMGGAYGASCDLSASTGVLVSSSYRDPNLDSTLEAFDAIPEALQKPASPEEMTSYILGTIGDIDTPISVDQKGFVSLERFLLEVSESARQVWRDQILSVTSADFIALGERIARANEKSNDIVVVASQSAVEESKSVKLTQIKILQ